MIMKLLVICLLGCIAVASAVSVADVIHEEFKSFMVNVCPHIYAGLLSLFNEYNYSQNMSISRGIENA